MNRLALVLTIVRVVYSNPFPQGVTASIAPKNAIPSGCGASWNGAPFGIGAEPILGAAALPTNKIMFSAASSSVTASSDAAMSMITPMPMDLVDGISTSVKMVAKLTASGGSDSDSTVTVRSTRTHTRTLTVRPVHPSSAPDSGNVVRVGVISQIEDGQIQAPVTPSAVTIPTIPKTNLPPKPTLIVTQISDGQIQAPKPAAVRRQTIDSPTHVDMGLACKLPGADSLTLTLKGTVLKDNKGRTGYIADNRQFQFDDPPQHGSIYTAGFSLCSDGYLALGGSKDFWQCRSGNFFNLYDQWIAAQCQKIRIRALNVTESACR